MQLISSTRCRRSAGQDVVEFSIAADIKVAALKIDMNTIVKRFKALQPGAVDRESSSGRALVVGLAGWFLLVRPQGAKVKQTSRHEATDVQAKIDAYHQQVAAARAAPKIEVADVYRLAKAMPDRTDMPDLLLELSQLARDTGIRFDSISPQPNAPIGSYTVAADLRHVPGQLLQPRGLPLPPALARHPCTRAASTRPDACSPSTR